MKRSTSAVRPGDPTGAYTRRIPELQREAATKMEAVFG
jgi:hypothetical protein